MSEAPEEMHRRELQGMSDHDLLILLHERLNSLAADMREYKRKVDSLWDLRNKAIGAYLLIAFAVTTLGVIVGLRG